MAGSVKAISNKFIMIPAAWVFLLGIPPAHGFRATVFDLKENEKHFLFPIAQSYLVRLGVRYPVKPFFVPSSETLKATASESLELLNSISDLGMELAPMESRPELWGLRDVLAQMIDSLFGKFSGYLDPFGGISNGKYLPSIGLKKDMDRYLPVEVEVEKQVLWSTETLRHLQESFEGVLYEASSLSKQLSEIQFSLTDQELSKGTAKNFLQLQVDIRNRLQNQIASFVDFLSHAFWVMRQNERAFSFPDHYRKSTRLKFLNLYESVKRSYLGLQYLELQTLLYLTQNSELQASRSEWEALVLSFVKDWVLGGEKMKQNSDLFYETLDMGRPLEFMAHDLLGEFMRKIFLADGRLRTTFPSNFVDQRELLDKLIVLESGDPEFPETASTSKAQSKVKFSNELFGSKAFFELLQNQQQTPWSLKWLELSFEKFKGVFGQANWLLLVIRNSQNVEELSRTLHNSGFWKGPLDWWELGDHGGRDSVLTGEDQFRIALAIEVALEDLIDRHEGHYQKTNVEFRSSRNSKLNMAAFFSFFEVELHSRGIPVFVEGNRASTNFLGEGVPSGRKKCRFLLSRIIGSGNT